MKNSVYLLALLLGLSACSQPETQDPDLKRWNNTQVTQRTIGGVETPTAYLFNCRKISEAENVHMYYSLIVDPTSENHLKNEKGLIETTYQQAELIIHQTIENHRRSGSSFYAKGLVNVPVDIQVVEDEKKNVLFYFIKANARTADWFRTYDSKNPYFKDIKEGDEVLKLMRFGGATVNLTESARPGLENSDSLECRSL